MTMASCHRHGRRRPTIHVFERGDHGVRITVVVVGGAT
jgi:hypothetical protein